MEEVKGVDMGQNVVDPVDRARLIVLSCLIIEGSKSSRTGRHISESSQQPHRLFDSDCSVADAWVSLVAIMVCTSSSVAFLCWYFFR